MIACVGGNGYKAASSGNIHSEWGRLLPTYQTLGKSTAGGQSIQDAHYPLYPFHHFTIAAAKLLKLLRLLLEYLNTRVNRIAADQRGGEFIVRVKELCPCAAFILLEGALKKFLDIKCGVRLTRLRPRLRH